MQGGYCPAFTPVTELCQAKRVFQLSQLFDFLRSKVHEMSSLVYSIFQNPDYLNFLNKLKY